MGTLRALTMFPTASCVPSAVTAAALALHILLDARNAPWVHTRTRKGQNLRQSANIVQEGDMAESMGGRWKAIVHTAHQDTTKVVVRLPAPARVVPLDPTPHMEAKVALLVLLAFTTDNH